MIIDKQGKLFGKINIIDFLIVVILIGAIALIGVKTFMPSVGENGELIGKNSEKVTATVEFFAEEISEFVLDDTIKIGDTVIEVGTENEIGKVTDVEYSDSVSLGTNADGEWVQSSKPGFKSVRITCEGEVDPYEHGFKLKGAKYYIGHTTTIAAGRAKLYLRISDIKYENQEQ